ncbi:MAG: EAL domain-containing protein [Clostridiales bacterium]|nr:EAL domain-containing protein [Clostridiales bacterium]
MYTGQKEETFTLYQQVVAEFSSCMNDYLYAYNFQADTYYITEQAAQRFSLPASCFHDVFNTHRQFVYHEDFDMLINDLQQLINGTKTEHNLRYRWLGADGSPIWINCRGRVIQDAEGKPFLMIGCINEIGKKPNADNISGLLKESAFEEQMKQFANLSEGFLLRLGIDDFKSINERLGVEYGDYVLHEVAACIQRCLFSNQYIYRLPSDEFMVVDLSGSTASDMQGLYHTIRAAVDKLVAQNQYEALYTISGGIVACNDIIPLTYEESMKLSEFALNTAKSLGKNQVYLFRELDYTAFLRKRAILRCLRKSVSNDFEGFELYFQPIVSTIDETLYCAETLLRFRTQEGEFLSPVEFIPILEESGLIIPVGKWIMRNAVKMCKECIKYFPSFKVSINLSYIQLLKSPLFEDIMAALNEYQLAPEHLIIELTESGHLENNLTVHNIWGQLKSAGIQIAIDDFGTGYSNLHNISDLRPHIVKVDRSFTVKSLRNDYERQLMAHIVHMVHSIGLRLVIEGIETTEELSQIVSLDPDYIQGYYYSKPCPQEEFYQKFIVA